jgi:hypothetical protein
MTRAVVLFAVVTAVLLALPPSGPSDTAEGTRRAAESGDGPAATGRPAGTLVFLSDSKRLIAIDVASGRRKVRRVASVAACGAQLFRSGDHVFFSGVQNARTVVFSAPVSLDRPPKRLGGAHAFVPSATAGRVWLAGVDCSRRKMVGVREVAADGEVTFSSDRRVPGLPAGAVPAGLVVQRGRAGLFVWDPSTGELGDRLALAAVATARGSELVGCTERSDCRDLAILDAASGSEVDARSGDEYLLEPDAELSPDGSLLAVPARTGRRWRVALVDARTGTSELVRGSRTGTRYPDLSWAPSSGWLFIRAGVAGPIGAYRPGARRVVTLPFRPPRGAIAYVAG